MNENIKLPLFPLITIVIGSIIGSGIFDLPKNISEHSSALAIIIAWVISGVGMLSLAFIFQSLANKRPDIEGGVYGYAKECFGNYVGFNSAFGYWVSAWLGNVGYLVIIFASLGYFFPIFGEGNTLISIIGASIVLWFFYFLILKGIKQATILNNIITIAKILPLIVFIIICIMFFKPTVFHLNFNPSNIGPLLPQIKSTMLVTVWVFLGIEGASIYSSRALYKKDVGKATIIGFSVAISLFVLVSLLSLGIVDRKDLLNIASPSTAGILSYVIGYAGIVIINGGILISVLGAFLSWLLLITEMPYIAAKDDIFPRALSKVNSKNTPHNSLTLSCALMQLFLIISYFASGTYYTIIILSASMIIIPYFFTTIFFIKEVITDKKQALKKYNNKELVVSILGTVFGAWLVYASGVKYVLLSMILYGLGLIIFVIARFNAKKTLFSNNFEKILAIIIITLLVIAVINLKSLTA
ncbi:basic amino acid/polyamine antiporter [Rickettsiales bacterium LUAb2]